MVSTGHETLSSEERIIITIVQRPVILNNQNSFPKPLIDSTGESLLERNGNQLAEMKKKQQFFNS